MKLLEKTKEYFENGYVILPAHDSAQQKLLYDFATNWIYGLLEPWVKGRRSEMPLNQYHIWSREIPPEHRQALGAKFRYQYPPPDARAALISEPMTSFLSAIGLQKYKVWDDGWGDVGFRLIRPGLGDGYPLCAKDWGIAKGVVSCWVPIVGRSSTETLLLVPASHRKEYPREVIQDKFAKGEPRFTGDFSELHWIRPQLNAGEVILYHPLTLHSEDISQSPTSRFNLEIRFQPTT